MSIGILPECQFFKTESGCKAGDMCLFPHCKVGKRAVAIVSTVPQLGCVSQDAEPSGLPKHVKYQGNPGRKVLGSVRRVRFTQSALRQASIREDKGKSPGKIASQTSSSAQSLRHEIGEQLSRRDLKTKSGAPAARHGTLPEIFTSSKKRTRLRSFRLLMSGVCRPHPPKNRRKESLW